MFCAPSNGYGGGKGVWLGDDVIGEKGRGKEGKGEGPREERPCAIWTVPNIGKGRVFHGEVCIRLEDL